MRPSLILDFVSRTVFSTVLVFSLYLLFSGHNQPGGGFVGGLVAGVSLVLVYASGGVDEVRHVLPVRGEVILGVGLLFAQMTAVIPWIFGRQVLQSEIFDLHLPVFGELHLATPLFFDIGVYLVVVGLAATTLTTLGAQEPRSTGAATGGRR